MVLSTPDFSAPARPQSHTLPVILPKIHTMEGHFILSGSPSNLFTTRYPQEGRVASWIFVVFKTSSPLEQVTIFFPAAVFCTRELLASSCQWGDHSPIQMGIARHFMVLLHLMFPL